MLKKWIDEIREKTDLYKTECWKYHLSGNVVEISILPVYLKKKKLYRCSVIAVGQVLQALSTKIEAEQLTSHIQSFPTLENPEIVATIRTAQRENFTDHSGVAVKKPDKQTDITTTLRNVVEQYQFYISKIKDPAELEFDGNISLEDYKNWFFVYSNHNNPFTWLNIGYLKETLRTEYSHPSSDYVRIMDLCQLGQYHNLQVPENQHVQSLIGIQPINVSAK